MRAQINENSETPTSFGSVLPFVLTLTPDITLPASQNWTSASPMAEQDVRHRGHQS